jgi:hypothetical protein
LISSILFLKSEINVFLFRKFHVTVQNSNINSGVLEIERSKKIKSKKSYKIKEKKMIQISSIVLLVCISFCSARVGLRDPGHWKAWNNIDLLNQYMGGFKFGGDRKLASDSYLNTLAQAVAETDQQPNEFINKYKSNG